MVNASSGRAATTSTERGLRDAVAALLRATGETQADLAKGIGRDRTQVTRKQGGAGWSIRDLHYLAAHYEMGPADLLRGVDHALACLPERRRAETVGGTQTTIPADQPSAKGKR
ncbi:acyltransferase [Streptomyces sp. ventii]|uniref:Acyltransferase n=2 Tax=Streptomyces spiramenti TaxID=2720606 RepID=A0ABX1AKA5_9ACTN|nr:acyltransferase [Streptomyces spiramenti]